MSLHDPDATVRRFIDGDLPEGEVREALHRIADDPEARSLLQFELQMAQGLAASRAPEPSSEFATNTMEQIEEMGAPGPSLQTRLHEWWEAAARPLVTIPVRPVHALATLALMVAVAWLAWPLAPSDPAPVASNQERTSLPTQTAAVSSNQQSQTVWTRFVYTDDDADSVAVAGDFSQWQPIPLSPHTVNGKTVWTGLVPVSRGEHEYQFVIDGEKWVTDPLASVKEDDGFGAKNAVLKL